MFSDVERSPSWHSPPLGADFAPHSYPPATSSGSISSARPPVQSGWFPLQDAAQSSSSSTTDPSRATHDMYADPTMLPPPAHRPQPQQQPQQWPHGDPYGADHRTPRGPYDSMVPVTPTTPSSAYSPLYGYASTPVHTPGANGGPGFGWQDARPMAPPSIHTTGLEHLRMPVYDDMHRVHAAAQGMHAMMGGGVHPMGLARYASPTSPLGRKKHHREISVGRWTSDEHRVFLKGLELYQGPSWGEIARMIGTRTSTQVRTHAQKFFTKLARSNQVLPYFENQIQKERARLVTQGAVPGNSGAATTVTALSTMDMVGGMHSSVTPTSTTAHSYAFSTLSPPRKREYPPPNGVHPSQRGYDDHSHAYAATQQHAQPRPPMPSQHGGVPMYPMTDPGQPMDPYKLQHRLDSPPSELLGLRKPVRPEYSGMPLTNDHLHQQPYGDHAMMPYAGPSDSYRDPTVGSYPPGPVHSDWSDATARSWPPSVDLASEPTHPGDPDSLPSVTRLLYRGGPPTQA